MAKVILISHLPLPYSKIGSWTTMYNYYLSQNNHRIDIIIAPPTENKIENISYYDLSYSFFDKVKRKLTAKNYDNIFTILKNIIKPSEKYIIQIIDNHGVVLPLNKFLIKEKLRVNCYLQFFYHGYPPFFGNFESRSFFEAIEEHVVLTFDSYKVYQSGYTELPCAFNVLHNGVNCDVFFPLKSNDKVDLRVEHNVSENKLIFIWCSQDRPKKGLDFILRVWKQLILKYDNIELWVIGCKRVIDLKGVKNIGRIPNNEIAKYYQLADFYLFPSLCHEGFGLSLTEALKCGCYCIASNNGGIPEVLKYGEYGKIIENPNFIEEWIEEIEKSIVEYTKNGNNNPYLKKLPEKLYSLNNWCERMNNIIEKANFS